VDLVARMSLATQTPVPDLLDTPPDVFDRLVELVIEWQKQDQQQRAREQLKARLGGRRGR
jgi:hypothetical protein